MSKLLNEEDFDIDISLLADESYTMNDGISEAKELYQRHQAKWLVGVFEDDYWEISKKNYPKLHHEFDFKFLDSFLFLSHVPKNIKNIVKCWLVTFIGENSTQAQVVFTIFKMVFPITNGFEKSALPKFIHFIESSDYSPEYKACILRAISNFLDFSRLECGNNYVPKLWELKTKLPRIKNNRDLPSSFFIFQFSNLLNQYFNEVYESVKSGNKNNLSELFRIYPVMLWWSITTIIPMRPVELVLLDSKCLLDTEKGIYYLCIDRRKLGENPKNKQLPDKIAISKELYDFLFEYKEMVKPYGETETFISPKAWANFSNHSRSFKTDLNQYNTTDLKNAILYLKRVFEKKYKYHFDKGCFVTPGDTRHLAVMNMIYMDYDLNLIARLAGHTSIKLIPNYGEHMEFWVDYNIYKKMQEARTSKSFENKQVDIPSWIIQKTLRHEEGTEKWKMDIGYCKDTNMACESFGDPPCNCQHWGISEAELFEKRDSIAKRSIKSRRDISEYTTTMKNLYRLVVKGEAENLFPTAKNQMGSLISSIEKEITSVAKVNNLLFESVENKIE
jgi:hypothetical protein